MTLLLNCQSLSKSFGNRVLFQDLSFSVFSEDRVGLIGPNGTGKSTLLKIFSGAEPPSAGTISPRKGLRIGYVPQSAEFGDETPAEVLLNTLESEREMPSYEKELLVATWLSKLGFSGSEPLAGRLSGGWKKRLSLAQVLLLSPDLLLLDEPTNHLDLEGILWLEKFLLKEAPCFILVSHDRYFLQTMVNRVVEINPVYPNGLFSIKGSYTRFLEKKEEFIQGQLEQERSQASKARRELDWLRRSPKARTTKSKSRVSDAHDLLQELSQTQNRNRQKKASIEFSASHRETRKLLIGTNLLKELDGRTLFQQLNFTISPGTRMGLMGPNGSGKTTLLQIMAGEFSPDQGTLKTADDLKIVYFDQHRRLLPMNITLRQALSPQGDFVDFHGKKIHINGWCKRFLFTPDILDMPLENLSGGERARISIAHLMLQPADVLLLDEPTNDLDISTLETLEESLLEFPGAVILITHDRCLLERVCNTLLVLGSLDQPVFADYHQWEASLKSVANLEKNKETKPTQPSNKPKLTYAEKKEHGQIEGQILKMEQEIRGLNLLLEDPAVSQDPPQLQSVCTQIGLAEIRLEQLYLRWDFLEKKLE